MIQTGKTGTFDGFGLSVGADVPAFGGTAKVLVGYMDAEDQTSAANDVQRYTFSVGYEYPLSKRTFVYTAAGYTQVKTEKAGVETKTKTSEVMLGMAHKF